MTSDPWIWIGAIFTIMIFSYLWKENPFYRFAEHVFVGISIGYIINIGWWNILQPKLYVPLVQERQYILIIPLIMGILMLFRFSEKAGWISFWPLAFLVGFMGYGIPATIDANLLKQMQATINIPMTGDWFMIFSGALIFVGTLACLIYFYFSFAHTGAVGKISQFGILLLMVSFGASFGYTVMARISLLIGRVLFLLRDWLGLVT
jgi:hypothetical protein